MHGVLCCKHAFGGYPFETLSGWLRVHGRASGFSFQNCIRTKDAKAKSHFSTGCKSVDGCTFTYNSFNGARYFQGIALYRKSSPSVTSSQPNRFAASLVTSTLRETSITTPVSLQTDIMEEYVELGNKLADAAGEIIRRFFRTSLDVVDKADLSPVTVADCEAEEAMRSLILQHFPSHGVYGEEGGLRIPVGGTEYIWVLDPIDGTKSFITGKPLFGILIALVHKGIPILGIIDQPVLRERWIGRRNQGTTLNGSIIRTRSACTSLRSAYMYTTSPHIFSGCTEQAFFRVRDKVKIPLYGCDCYAYGLLAAGHVDLVVESGLKPYDFLALVPVIEGAGGSISDWHGDSLHWWPTSDYPSSGSDGVEVVASGNVLLHKSALGALEWK